MSLCTPASDDHRLRRRLSTMGATHLSFETEASKRAIEEVNQIANLILGRPPRFRYFKLRDDHYVFAWTTEKDRRGKFYALKYRVTKAMWKVVHKVPFGRRKKAKERALKWYKDRALKIEAKRRG